MSGTEVRQPLPGLRLFMAVFWQIELNTNSHDLINHP